MGFRAIKSRAIKSYEFLGGVWILRDLKSSLGSSWWLNQPIWKICSSKWVHLLEVSGWTFKKNVWNHHQVFMGRSLVWHLLFTCCFRGNVFSVIRNFPPPPEIHDDSCYTNLQNCAIKLLKSKISWKWWVKHNHSLKIEASIIMTLGDDLEVFFGKCWGSRLVRRDFPHHKAPITKPRKHINSSLFPDLQASEIEVFPVLRPHCTATGEKLWKNGPHEDDLKHPTFRFLEKEDWIIKRQIIR